MTSLFEQAAREHIASRGAKQTRSLYLADLEKWLKVCQEHGFDPDEPTKESATVFRDEHAAGKLTKNPPAEMTQRRVLSALSSMYDAAGLVNRFKSSKYLGRPPKDDIGTTKSFTPEESQKLLETIEADTSKDGIRDGAIFQILYETGLRVGTIVRMERKSLERHEGKIVFLTTVKKRGRVPVALPEKSTVKLEAWLTVAPESKYVFPATRGNGPLTKATINKHLEVYGRVAGVVNAHPHRFRVTYITEALDAGVALHEVQASVHHSDPGTTLRYDRRVRGLGVSSALAAFRNKKS